MRQKTQVEALSILDELDALCAPMHDYETLLADPQVREDQMLLVLQTSAGPFPTIGVPWNFSVTPAGGAARTTAARFQRQIGGNASQFVHQFYRVFSER
jgi:crotonobetainyl-CoA:carnitine CoA-transferase CaiB-like acyl-CoA transferase